MRRFAITLALATMLAAGPTLGLADDQQIAQAVVQNLKKHQSSGELKGFDIDLNVEEGKVTLTGNVADARQHKLALDAARFVPGVKLVVNDLKVQGSQAQHPEQQKTLGANLASLFRKPAAARPAQAQPSQPPAPATQEASNAAPQQNAGILAGLRRAWKQPQQEVKIRPCQCSTCPLRNRNHSLKWPAKTRSRNSNRKHRTRKRRQCRSLGRTHRRCQRNKRNLRSWLKTRPCRSSTCPLPNRSHSLKRPAEICSRNSNKKHRTRKRR